VLGLEHAPQRALVCYPHRAKCSPQQVEQLWESGLLVETAAQRERRPGAVKELRGLVLEQLQERELNQSASRQGLQEVARLLWVVVERLPRQEAVAQRILAVAVRLQKLESNLIAAGQDW
jgi:hypothetical protein